MTKKILKPDKFSSPTKEAGTDTDTLLTNVGTANDSLSVIWKSHLTDKIKRSFFQAAVLSILIYGCTTWTLTKRMQKKLDGNYIRMLQAILNNPRGNTLQSSSYTAIYRPSRKLSKLDESDMQDTAREAGTRCSSMDLLTWPSKSRATCSNLHAVALWRYGVWSWGPARSDEWLGGVAREGQGYLR